MQPRNVEQLFVIFALALSHTARSLNLTVSTHSLENAQNPISARPRSLMGRLMGTKHDFFHPGVISQFVFRYFDSHAEITLLLESALRRAPFLEVFQHVGMWPSGQDEELFTSST